MRSFKAVIRAEPQKKGPKFFIIRHFVYEISLEFANFQSFPRFWSHLKLVWRFSGPWFTKSSKNFHDIWNFLISTQKQHRFFPPFRTPAVTRLTLPRWNSEYKLYFFWGLDSLINEKKLHKRLLCVQINKHVFKMIIVFVM